MKKKKLLSAFLALVLLLGLLTALCGAAAAGAIRAFPEKAAKQAIRKKRRRAFGPAGLTADKASQSSRRGRRE